MVYIKAYEEITESLEIWKKNIPTFPDLMLSLTLKSQFFIFTVYNSNYIKSFINAECNV